MTRTNAREIAVQMVFSLSFGGVTAQEVLDSQLTVERFSGAGGGLPPVCAVPE